MRKENKTLGWYIFITTYLTLFVVAIVGGFWYLLRIESSVGEASFVIIMMLGSMFLLGANTADRQRHYEIYQKNLIKEVMDERERKGKNFDERV